METVHRVEQQTLRRQTVPSSEHLRRNVRHAGNVALLPNHEFQRQVEGGKRGRVRELRVGLGVTEDEQGGGTQREARGARRRVLIQLTEDRQAGSGDLDPEARDRV